jgi:type IV pilus assembly protein PilW
MKPSMITRTKCIKIAPCDPFRHQAGLTLVEIMVSLVLGLLVLLAVASIYIGSRQTYRVQEENARIQESGKYALEVIGRSLKQAGADTEMTFNPVSFTLECIPPVCTAVDNNGVVAATDTIRTQFYAGREELNGGLWRSRDCLGGLVTVNGLVTNIFSLVGADLSCNTGAGAQPLVSNVVDLQVVYGIDPTLGTTAATGGQAVQYVSAPTAAQWSQVVSARVCVQVRSAANGLTVTPQQYLNCAGALGTATGAAALTTAAAGDLRMYRSFVGTFNLRNRINASL